MSTDTALPVPAGAAAAPPAGAGLTPRELGRMLRCSPDRIRAMIRRGELPAVDMGERGRSRLVILPDGLAQLLRRRAAGPPPKQRRRRRPTAETDFYPD